MKINSAKNDINIFFFSKNCISLRESAIGNNFQILIIL